TRMSPSEVAQLIDCVSDCSTRFSWIAHPARLTRATTVMIRFFMLLPPFIGFSVNNFSHGHFVDLTSERERRFTSSTMAFLARPSFQDGSGFAPWGETVALRSKVARGKAKGKSE